MCHQCKFPWVDRCSPLDSQRCKGWQQYTVQLSNRSLQRSLSVSSRNSRWQKCDRLLAYLRWRSGLPQPNRCLGRSSCSGRRYSRRPDMTPPDPSSYSQPSSVHRPGSGRQGSAWRRPRSLSYHRPPSKNRLRHFRPDRPPAQVQARVAHSEAQKLEPMTICSISLLDTPEMLCESDRGWFRRSGIKWRLDSIPDATVGVKESVERVRSKAELRGLF